MSSPSVPSPAPWPRGVLMCPPDHFDVVDVKNAFMEGHVGRVDRRLARAQWDALVATYRALDVDVHLLEPVAGLEDMVFTANTACVLPRAEGDGCDVVMSRMNHASRRREVGPTRRWLATAGFAPRELPDDVGTFEGHGDVLVVPGRRFAFGGHGGRTTRRALDALAALVQTPIVPLPLLGAPFYHLDTCLTVLDEDTVLVHPPAFGPGALETLREHVGRVLVADPGEAASAFACNGHALRGGHVVLAAQAERTARQLERAGFSPHPVDVSQFHLSGGSVFCLRMDLPALPAARDPASATA